MQPLDCVATRPDRNAMNQSKLIVDVANGPADCTPVSSQPGALDKTVAARASLAGAGEFHYEIERRFAEWERRRLPVSLMMTP